LELHRSDLNVDGLVNANDWPLFFPNMLADMGAMTGVQRALAGDIDLDGDNDINDFLLFKTDFDAANGIGAFEAMLNGVPEPSAALLVALASLGLIRGRRRLAGRAVPLAAVAIAVVVSAQHAAAAPSDLTTYTTENFPLAASFPSAVWVTTPTTATLQNNADASVLLSPDSALNKRIVARVTPGTDDDVVGFVLGFESGDSFIGSTADYLLIDWKGASQNFDFADGDLGNFHHDQTGTGNMPVGLALSRITGSPTADEFWQHANLPENSTGGVEELARGATLGSAAYNRSGGSHQFDITYTATNLKVSVDGVEQFNVNGSFPDGNFGLYSAWQGPQPTFSDVQIFPSGFTGLSATVDRATGNITLRNTGTIAVSFDYYEFDSLSGSLNVAGWNSLDNQNFQPAGAGIGQTWDEAGGSDAFELGEVYLQSMSTLAGSASVSLGNAYNNSLNGEDLVLRFNVPGEGVLVGAVQYVGEAPTLQGDFDDDGDVDGADFIVWQRQLGGPGSADDSGNGVVDAADLGLWKANFGTNPATAAANANAAAVPEPAALTLVAWGALVLAASRRRGA
jgi:hypothetical protein